LDILDNYAFVRTAGYLASPADIYVALGQVKKYNLRKGDAIVGAIRQPRDNDFQNRQKYNALATIDFVNGAAPEEAVVRDDFNDLVAVHASEGLGLNGRFGSVKKGDRVLVDAAAGASRTAVIRDLAAEISASATDAHLMVVVSDGLPEDVTALSRGVRGEVSASSYDRHADEHVTVADLAIARAKRLVEKGHHVVVLIDSMTRVSKNQLAVIQGSRPLGDGAVDAAVFSASKRLFGAGRALETGGSLTVIATIDNQTDGFPGAVRDELLDIATAVVTL
jgi:transcription termination factor Rho